MLATPPLNVCVAPIWVAPSMKVTVPAGVAVAGLTGDTVAVKVTDWPKTDGLAGAGTTTVVVEALPTL